MKKLLLVATVLVGGMTFAQAGINISIGIPLPRSVVVVGHPPRVHVAPVCAPPRIAVSRPPVVQYRPAYAYGYCKPSGGHNDRYRHGHKHDRHDRGHGHRR